MPSNEWVDVPAQGAGGADDGWEDVQPPAVAAAAKPKPMATGSYQNRKGGPVLNVNQSPVNAMAQGLERTLGIENPTSLVDAITQFGKNVGRAGKGVLEGPEGVNKIAQGLADTVDSAGRNIYQGVKRKDWRSAGAGVGETAGLVGMAEEGGEGDVRLADRIGDKVGDATRDEAGKVKPTVKGAAGVIGGGLGAVYGASHGPYGSLTGAGLGYRAGTLSADMLLPKKPSRGAGGAPLPSADEFYQNKGEDLMKRGKEQEALDRKNKPALPKGRDKLFNIPDATTSDKVYGNDPLPEPKDQAAMPPVEKKATKGRLKDEITVLPEGQKAPYRITPEQVPGKPQLRNLAKSGIAEAGPELQRRGEKVLYTPNNEGYPPPRSVTKLSDQMGEAEPRLSDKIGKTIKKDARVDTLKEIKDDIDDQMASDFDEPPESEAAHAKASLGIQAALDKGDVKGAVAAAKSSLERRIEDLQESRKTDADQHELSEEYDNAIDYYKTLLRNLGRRK